jgi:uncharacterized RDD family membrane protein YckC
MSCPACGTPMPAGQERCAGCGANVAPLTEGALAPDPSARRAEPLREIPGLKKKERTWKDDVRDRMRDRKRRRAADGELPLFKDGLDEDADAEPGAPEPGLDNGLGGAGRGAMELGPEPEAPRREVRPGPAPRTGSGFAARASDVGLASGLQELGVDEADLPLRTSAVPATSAASDLRLGASDAPPLADTRPSRGPIPEPEDEWTLGGESSAPSRPVERPAYSGERAQAAALDLGLLVVLWSVVVYFASRAAHVGLAGLRPSWPYLAGYLAFLGLAYAVYFTGTTGQTLGKIATGLRVVDAGGRPPGYLRAFLRAALGSVGVLAAGTGLIPMLLDPARRALHDRVSKTRVVKG